MVRYRYIIFLPGFAACQYIASIVCDKCEKEDVQVSVGCQWVLGSESEFEWEQLLLTVINRLHIFREK